MILHVDQEETAPVVEQFASKYGLTSPFLMDPNSKTGRLYQLRGTPTTFFIDPKGVVQDSLPGFIKLDWIDSNFSKSS